MNWVYCNAWYELVGLIMWFGVLIGLDWWFW